MPASPTQIICAPSSGTIPGGLLVLKDVRAASHPGYGRVTFEFTGLTAPPAVGATYTVTPAATPGVQDGSGLPVRIDGKAFLRIVFRGASGHDTLNTPPRETYSGPFDLRPGLATVVELKQAGDFEGYLTWVVGLSQSRCYKAQVLSGPARLVLDIPAEGGG